MAQGIGAVVVQPFAIRLLDPQQWGQVSFSLSFISIGLIAISAGLPMVLSTMYFDPDRGPDKARSLNGFGVGLSIVGAGLAASIFALVTIFNGTIDSVVPYLISVGIIGFHGITQMSLAYLRSQHKALAFVVITVIATVLGHVAGLLAIIYIAPTATIYMGSFALCVVAASLAGVLTSRPGAPMKYRESLRNAVRASLPVLPHSIALVLMLQGESVLITMLRGEELVGRYNAVMPLALGPLAVIMALSNVWQTTIFSHRGVDNTGQVAKVQREAVFIGFMLTLGGSGVAVLATHVLVNDPEPVLLLLARTLPLLGYGYVVFLISTSQLFAIGKTRLMAVVTPCVAAVGLGLAFFPAGSGNLLLLGVIKVTSYLLLGVAYVFVVRRYDPKLVNMKLMLKGMAAAVAVTVLMLMMPDSIGWGIGSALATCVLGLAGGGIYVRRLHRPAAKNGAAIR
ncbi:oligosaccharide flippase family protein [Pseudarthrobacter sp. NamE5]|uniref:oligosaccharide flippase family protein n=1 Tax=Pseudarthrobacter sp. NamE5 TaxID=2576839 RepID=UPI00197AA29D|nr:oligosaccharide flippase family protein [Pseudarthrobacter sp. NamE5]